MRVMPMFIVRSLRQAFSRHVLRGLCDKALHALQIWSHDRHLSMVLATAIGGTTVDVEIGDFAKARPALSPAH
jgi:hypothetical protein